MNEKHFFPHGARCEISCIDKNKRVVELNRTEVIIRNSNNSESKIEPCLWSFRGLDEDEGEWLISLDIQNEFYQIKSLGKVPFIHNGVYSYHSHIRQGDAVDIGHTRIRFLKVGQAKNEYTKRKLPWSEWNSDCFIVLEGETGTGKSTLARSIHEQLHNELSPFVHINISAYAKNLVESELFGHEKGSFTGAVRDKRGAIEQAGKGTLFIDEVDSLDRELQVKLLTFLDNKRYRKVGGERELKADCRIIFASGQSLLKMTKEKRLREDFYFRLMSGFHHRLLSLKNNTKLIENFISEFEKSELVTFSDDLKEYLVKCPWPGNYRQLSSYLQRKKSLNKNKCLLTLGPEETELKECFINEDLFDEIVTLKELRKRYCIKVFNSKRGSIQDSCESLGITRNTLKAILAS